MAFFADLSRHSYSPTGVVEILNIGWLDEGKPFSVGPTTREFQDALLELCQHPIILNLGFHVCWFCRGKTNVSRGNGQIRILGNNGIWYAAPTVVHHYTTQHKYSPPTDFVEAVLSPIAVGTDYGWGTDATA